MKLRTLGHAMLGYQRPLWRLVEQRGPLIAAPVAAGLLTLCLTVSGLWASPGLGHRLAADCCAYRGWDPGLGPSPLPLDGFNVPGECQLRTW